MKTNHLKVERKLRPKTVKKLTLSGIGFLLIFSFQNCSNSKIHFTGPAVANKVINAAPGGAIDSPAITSPGSGSESSGSNSNSNSDSGSTMVSGDSGLNGSSGSSGSASDTSGSSSSSSSSTSSSSNSGAPASSGGSTPTVTDNSNSNGSSGSSSPTDNGGAASSGSSTAGSSGGTGATDNSNKAGAVADSGGSSGSSGSGSDSNAKPIITPEVPVKPVVVASNEGDNSAAKEETSKESRQVASANGDSDSDDKFHSANKEKDREEENHKSHLKVCKHFEDEDDRDDRSDDHRSEGCVRVSEEHGKRAKIENTHGTLVVACAKNKKSCSVKISNHEGTLLIYKNVKADLENCSKAEVRIVD